MRNYLFIFTIAALLISPYAFANVVDSNEGSYQSCRTIVKACLNVGFAKEAKGRNFWIDCMKPLLLGKKVKDISIDEKEVTACRKFKIEKMKKELKELENVK